MKPRNAHVFPGDTRYIQGRECTERTAAELATMQPTDADRQRGRDRRRLEDALERRALARELGNLD